MKFGKILSVLSALAASVSAQVTTSYTDPTTGITFQRLVAATSAYDMAFGIALPQNPLSNSEFIGQIRGPIGTGTGVGYSAVTLGPGMVNNLLLVAWKNGPDIVHSFRMTNGYVAPFMYPGNAVATTMYTEFTSTHWIWTFRCQNCATWSTSPTASTCSNGGFDATQQFGVMGWAQSTSGVVQPTDPASAISYHNGFGLFAVDLINARNALYYSWIYTYC